VSASHQISGAVFIDPSQQQSETSAEWTQRVREAVMQVVYQWHHSGDPHPLEVTRCSVGSPRGPHNNVAYIELIYGFKGKKGGWRCGFSVSHSDANGFRLWTEVRNSIRARQ
jgi:hypothetical protein